MSEARETAQRAIGARVPAPVSASGGAFYDATNFAADNWLVYEISEGGTERWVVNLTGPHAEAKAKAIAMILGAKP